ncbi:glycosyltransferase involved in cell wall biosynthesis [Streptomyces pristinaespiralis]|uniref:glycosyltransferase family 2 protein n=1 Tax=Streptomyces pristinaespiralis TaxID=38300 RepID=UPI0033CE013E
MSVKVSVVIPVYNPGKYIDPCIDSLVRQTLPAGEFEVLFVDDGSTDDTPERLDKLAAEHPHFRVIHIPNSGWPGKPRNIGVAEALGEYVQFLDQDDHLGTDALRRLYDMGHRNGSDIVIGKVASNFRGVPHGVFRTNREKCTLRDAPLFDSLTPHKMFRTAFLREHGIAYPEGKRRLEDQLYMMRAYFPAKVVSILGTYTCYHYSKRDDGKNAGSAKLVPEGYYGNLREVLDVVVANTEPGALRDRVLRRFYRVEMLGRLSEPAVLKYEDDYLREMVDAVRPLALEYMDDSVHDGLGPMLRMRSTLLRENNAEGLVRLARLGASVKGSARLENVRWETDGRITVTMAGRLVHGEQRLPLKLLRRDERLYVHPDITSGFLPEGALLDITDDLAGFQAELSLRDREKAVEWLCPTTLETRVEMLDDEDDEIAESGANGPDGAGRTCEVVLRGTGVLSTQGGRKGRGSLPRGFWDAWVSVRGLGLVRKTRLGAERAEHVDGQCLPALLSAPARPVIPYFTDPHGNLTLDVSRRGKKLVPYMEGRTVLCMPGRSPQLRLDLVTTATTAPAAVQLVLSKPPAAPAPDATGAAETGRQEPETSEAPDAAVVHAVPSTLRPVHGRAHLSVPRRIEGAPAGTWQLGVRLDGEKGRALALCTVDVDATGRLRLDDSLPAPDPALLRKLTVQRRRAALREAVRAVAGPVVRRLPSSGRRKVRRFAARLLG